MKEELYLVLDTGDSITETDDFSYLTNEDATMYRNLDDAKEAMEELDSTTAYLLTVTVKKVQKIGGLTDVELD